MNDQKPTTFQWSNSGQTADAAGKKRVEDAVKGVDPHKRIIPSDPHAVHEVDERAKHIRKHKRHFHETYPGLDVPPKKDGHGR